MSTDDAPHLELFIERVSKNAALGIASAVESSGEVSGYLRISRREALVLRDISIYFEGVSRNWIATKSSVQLYIPIFKAERKFLSQAQNTPPTDLSPCSSQDEWIYKVPFHFIIPTVLPNVDTNLPRYCSQLPPSVELGQVIIDKKNGTRFAQPSIQYYVKAVIGYASGEARSQTRKVIEESAPVVISPYTIEYPPTDIRDFPAEFKDLETQPLKRHVFQTALGTMTVSTREPPAMEFSDESDNGSTTASLKLELQSRNSSKIHGLLENLTFTILSLVRVKTFYSLKPFPRLPSLSLLEVENTTRLRDELIKLEARTEKELSWDYIYDLTSQSRDGPEAQTGKQTNNPLSGRWATTLDLPIKVDHRLIPTFCTSVVARLYSVIIRVKIAGARSKSFDLEVPLQVTNSPLSAVETRELPSGESRRSEDIARESEVEVEDDELPEHQKDPPHYYP